MLKGNGVNVDMAELIAMRAYARGIELAQRRKNTAVKMGTHQSRWRGRGVDFRESRLYQPGDDIRHIDWRVTARTERTHTKLFQEEREQSLLLLLDMNPSLRFGTRVRFKSVQIARVAALLAWLTVQQGDRVGILGFGGGINAEVKPTGGRRGVLRVLRAMRDWDAIADKHVSEPLSLALARVRRLLKPGMRVVMLSDGYAADAAAGPLLTRIAQHHEMGAITVSDVLETTTPPPGRYAVSLAGVRRVFNFSDANLQAQWPEQFTQRRKQWREQLSRLHAHTVELDTCIDPWRVLAPLLTRTAGGAGQ